MVHAFWFIPHVTALWVEIKTWLAHIYCLEHVHTQCLFDSVIQESLNHIG